MTLTNTSTKRKGFSQSRSRTAAPDLSGIASADTQGLSNTPLICQTSPDITLGIDYLSYILPITDVSTVLDHLSLLSDRFVDAFEVHHGRGHCAGRPFANRADSANGMMVLWNLPDQNKDTGSMRVAVAGKSLLRCTVLETVRFIRSLPTTARFNRIDICADDYSRSMLPSQLMDAYRAENHTGFRSCKYYDDVSGNVYDSGWTVAFGARSSDRYTRYYNAKPLHKIDAFRFEIELKGKLAREHIEQILLIDDEPMLATMLSSLIAGNISFIDRSSGARSARCKPLPFWADWLSRLGSSIRLRLVTLKPTLSKTIAWIERSVSSSLALVCKYIGGDSIQYLYGLIKLGEQKFTARHETILKAAKREYFREYPIGPDSFVYDSTFQ